MTRAMIAATCLVLAAGTAAPAAADEADRNNVSIPLTGFRETPKSLVVEGKGRAKLRIRGSVIHYELSYEGLTSGVIQAHIHIGEDATTGGVAAFLCGGSAPACPSPGGTLSGTVDAADVLGPADQGVAPGEIADVIRALRNGAIYVNVHTNAFPSGELRGDAKARG